MTVDEMREMIDVHRAVIKKADKALKGYVEKADECRTVIKARRKKIAVLQEKIAAAREKGEREA